VLIATVIVHGQAITLAALHREERIGIGPGLAIDGPAIIAAAASCDLLKTSG